MPIRKTITVTLTTHGEVDQPCTAACPDLALSTDGPTVAAALSALAKAIEYLPVGEEFPAAEVVATPPPVPPAPIVPDLPRLTPARTTRSRRVSGQSTPVARAS